MAEVHLDRSLLFSIKVSRRFGDRYDLDRLLR